MLKCVKTRHFVLFFLFIFLFSCRPNSAENAENIENTVETEEPTENTGSNLEPIDLAQFDEETLAEMPLPSTQDYAQTCDSDEMCRVYQASDWSAEVVCCYEYGCALDYIAINQNMWSLILAWRQAHAFDCVAHAQELGPCNNRAIHCGLSQEPPPARCVEGLCEIAYPAVWPQIIPTAQTCNMNNNCDSIRVDMLTTEHICCQTCPTGAPIAVNNHTLEEITAWRETLDCSSLECEDACSQIDLADAQCLAGRCVISEL